MTAGILAALAAVVSAAAVLALQATFDVSSEVIFEPEFETYEYRYFVTNLTEGPVTGITVTDIYPDGCLVNGWKATVGSFDPATRIWTIPALPTAPVGRLIVEVAAIGGTPCPGTTTTTTTRATTTTAAATTTTTSATTTSATTTTTATTITGTVTTTATTSSTTSTVVGTTTTTVPRKPTELPCREGAPLRNLGLLGTALLLGGTGVLTWPRVRQFLPVVVPVSLRNPFGTTVSPLRGLRPIAAAPVVMTPPRRAGPAALPIGGPVQPVETIVGAVTPTAPAREKKDGGCGGCCCCCCGGRDPHAAALAVLGTGNDPRSLQGFTVSTTTTTRYGFEDGAPAGEAAATEAIEEEVAAGLTGKLVEATEKSPALLALLQGDLEQAGEVGGLLGGDLGAALAAMLVEVVEERKARADAAAAEEAEPPAPAPPAAPTAVRIEVAPAPGGPPPAPPPPPSQPPPGSGLGI